MPLLLIPGAILIIVLFSAFLVFDSIVRMEYDSYRSDWEKDGRPHGFFWCPVELRKGWLIKLRGGLAMQRCSMAWLFWTPAWMKGDPDPLARLRRLRVLVLTWNVGVVALAVFALKTALR